MLRRRVIVTVVLGLMVGVSLALNETNTTTTSSTVANDIKADSNETTNETNVPIVHAVNAHARKIEMTKLASAADVTASLKSQTGTSGSFVISTTMISIIAALILVVIISVSVGMYTVVLKIFSIIYGLKFK